MSLINIYCVTFIQQDMIPNGKVTMIQHKINCI